MPSLLIYVTGDRLGDGLIRLPVVLGLREAFPGYRITWVAGRRASIYAGALAPLIRDRIDEVRERVGLGVSILEFLHGPRIEGTFDIIIDTQQKVLTCLLLRRVPHGVFVSRAAGFRFSDRRPPDGARAAESVQEGLMELVNLVAPRPLERVRMPTLPAPYLDAAAALLPHGGCYVGLAPGAGGARKRWPLRHYLELARLQAARGRVPVFLLGPTERGWRTEIAGAVPEAVFPELDYRGPLERGPLLAMAVSTRLALGVANDAGPSHLLAACGRPVITLFGHTSPSKFVAPGGRGRVIRAADYGRGGMAAIPVSVVAAAVEELLGDAGAGG